MNERKKREAREDEEEKRKGRRVGIKWVAVRNEAWKGKEEGGKGKGEGEGEGRKK